MLVGLRKKVLVFVSCLLGVMFFCLLRWLGLGKGHVLVGLMTKVLVCVSCLFGVMFFSLLH